MDLVPRVVGLLHEPFDASWAVACAGCPFPVTETFAGKGSCFRRSSLLAAACSGSALNKQAGLRYAQARH